jgi:hypothetical protein
VSRHGEPAEFSSTSTGAEEPLGSSRWPSPGWRRASAAVDDPEPIQRRSAHPAGAGSELHGRGGEEGLTWVLRRDFKAT